MACDGIRYAVRELENRGKVVSVSCSHQAWVVVRADGEPLFSGGSPELVDAFLQGVLAHPLI